jgi:hypothetical protein
MARPVMNPAYQQGMASSIQFGISSLNSNAEAALIVLADQPFLKPETINLLIEEFRRQRPEIVIPVYNGFRGNPVLLTRSVFGELSALSGDIGCRAIFGNHTTGILKLDVPDPGVLVDLDTAADVHRFQEFEASDTARLSDLADLSGREVTGPQLVIVGQDPVAKVLVDLARLLEFNVLLVDPFARAEDVPEASILRVLDLSRVTQSDELFVVVTSGGRFDEEAVEQALNTDAVYVALLASEKRARELRSALQRKGMPEEKLAKLSAPAGLAIGAMTPAEIALSILAEAVLKRAQNQRK